MKVWGYYSPKLHDGAFLKDHESEMRQLIKGAVIIADNHFSRGKKIFKDIKFHTNFAIRKDKKEIILGVDNDQFDFVDHITDGQMKFNKQHQKTRARVESRVVGLTKSLLHHYDILGEKTLRI